MIPIPGPGRIALVLLAALPALLAYPWPTPTGRWLLGLAVLAAVALLGWWRGMHFTTALRRRLTMSRHRDGAHADHAGPDVRTTALLRVVSGPPGAGLPLGLIAGYRDRYGLVAHHIRITSHDDREAGRQTWIGLTYSAAENLPALQARSAQIPLRETAEVAARRLADHLREIGWETTLVTDGGPALFDPAGREAWDGVTDGAGHITAYRIAVDNRLPDTLAAVWGVPSAQTWSVLELAGGADHCTVASGCALRGAAVDPLPQLTAERGDQWAALRALGPDGPDLPGHTEVSIDGLATIRSPAAVAVLKPA